MRLSGSSAATQATRSLARLHPPRSCLPYHSIPYHTVSCHIIPCHTIPYHTIPHPAMPYHTIPYRAMPHHAIPYHTIPYHTIPCHTTPCHTTPCQAMPQQHAAPHYTTHNAPSILTPPRVGVQGWHRREFEAASVRGSFSWSEMSRGWSSRDELQVTRGGLPVRDAPRECVWNITPCPPCSQGRHGKYTCED